MSKKIKVFPDIPDSFQFHGDLQASKQSSDSHKQSSLSNEFQNYIWNYLLRKLLLSLESALVSDLFKIAVKHEGSESSTHFAKFQPFALSYKQQMF